MGCDELRWKIVDKGKSPKRQIGGTVADFRATFVIVRAGSIIARRTSDLREGHLKSEPMPHTRASAEVLTGRDEARLKLAEHQGVVHRS